MWRWTLGVSATAGVTGLLCCVAPMALFLLGLMGGIQAISFANWFYRPDGSAGLGAWALRAVAAALGIAGVVLFRRRYDACSVDRRTIRRKVALTGFMVAALGIGLFFTLDRISSWYFDRYVVPAQQAEYHALSAQPRGRPATPGPAHVSDTGMRASESAASSNPSGEAKTARPR